MPAHYTIIKKYAATQKCAATQAAPSQGFIAAFLSTSKAYLGVEIASFGMPTEPCPALPGPLAGQSDLRWLARYARHCGLHEPEGLPIEQALRSAFGKAAWRIVCRSPKAHFLPLLRNRELSIHSLIDYCKRLAEHSFVVTPKAVLLDFFVTQRRLYFDRPCRIPQDEDYVLMRIADRMPDPRTADMALVSNWVHQTHYTVRAQHQWPSLVRKAREFRLKERMALTSSSDPIWHFHCGSCDWRGYRIEPITDSAGLWLEGAILGNCVYKLRWYCTGLKPSRFFTVKRRGKRVATLELAWNQPQEDFIGMDREWGRWSLQDLRLSFNRLPDSALADAMEGFARMYNLWAKRPKRMLSGELEDLQDRIARINGHWTWSAANRSFRSPSR